MLIVVTVIARTIFMAQGISVGKAFFTLAFAVDAREIVNGRIFTGGRCFQINVLDNFVGIFMSKWAFICCAADGAKCFFQTSCRASAMYCFIGAMFASVSCAW